MPNDFGLGPGLSCIEEVDLRFICRLRTDIRFLREVGWPNFKVL